MRLLGDVVSQVVGEIASRRVIMANSSPASSPHEGCAPICVWASDARSDVLPVFYWPALSHIGWCNPVGCSRGLGPSSGPNLPKRPSAIRSAMAIR